LPNSSVVVCGMPRSGTSLLGGLLASTGCIGRPGEFFDPSKEPPDARANYRTFVERVVRSRSVGGVFGVKFVHNQLSSFLDALRALPGNAECTDRELLEQVLPQPRFVWVQRRDIVAQAVSWWRAEKTGEWRLPVGATRETTSELPSFDFEEVDGLVAEIVRGNERWERWFATNQIQAHVVVYEELAADAVAMTRRVLDFLEIDVPDSAAIAPHLEQQADELNVLWTQRYRERAALSREG
jgi:LPS sulfotransferase NodH